MKRLRFLVGGAVSVLALLTAAPSWSAGETLAVFTKNQTNPYFLAVRVGADMAARDMDARTVHFVPTKPDNILEQLSQVEDVIVRKPDAVVFIPVDYKALVPSVEKLNKAGIPVVNVTDPIAGGKVVAYAGADDYNLAKETARYLLTHLGGKGRVIIIEGIRGSLNNADRVRGFTDALKEFPGVELLASQPGNYQRLQALQVMENLMQSFPAVDGILAANDAMAIGAIEALEGAGRSAQVVGINGTKEAVELIKDGKMLASGDYNGFIQGCVGVMIALRHLRGEETPERVVLKPVVVDKSNTADYEIDVEKRACPTWDDVTKLAAAE